MKNYCKFYGKMFIVMTAIIGGIRELKSYEVFQCLSNQIHRHICVMLEFLFLQYGQLFGSHVLLNKRQLTGNCPESTR